MTEAFGANKVRAMRGSHVDVDVFFRHARLVAVACGRRILGEGVHVARPPTLATVLRIQREEGRKMASFLSLLSCLIKGL